MDVPLNMSIMRFTVICVTVSMVLMGCGTTSSRINTEKSFSRFEQSSYLQELWADTCSFPLIKENLVILAHASYQDRQPHLECDWAQTAVGFNDIGVIFNEEVSDLDPKWLACESDSTFAQLVWDAARIPSYNLIHLGNGISPNSRNAAVLISKCHYWDEYYCTIKRGNPNCKFPNADQILSMAYAVLDLETGKILW